MLSQYKIHIKVSSAEIELNCLLQAITLQLLQIIKKYACKLTQVTTLWLKLIDVTVISNKWTLNFSVPKTMTQQVHIYLARICKPWSMVKPFLQWTFI